ncbi:unnamed protein product [Victoria cruziana]
MDGRRDGSAIALRRKIQYVVLDGKLHHATFLLPFIARREGAGPKAAGNSFRPWLALYASTVSSSSHPSPSRQTQCRSGQLNRYDYCHRKGREAEGTGEGFHLLCMR